MQSNLFVRCKHSIFNFNNEQEILTNDEWARLRKKLSLMNEEASADANNDD